MRSINFFFPLVLLSLCFLTIGQTNAEQELPLISSDVNFQQIIPQGSTGVRVGVFAATDENFKIHPVRLFVYLPPTESSSLCVEVASQDGRYGAKMEYDISSQSAGRYLLEYPKQHILEFGQYRSNDIAVLMKLSNQCNGKIAGIAIAAWNPTTSIKKLKILLNPGATRTFLLVPTLSGKTSKISCTPIRGKEKREAFDTECFLSISENFNLKMTVIKRYSFSTSLPQIALPLELP